MSWAICCFIPANSCSCGATVARRSLRAPNSCASPTPASLSPAACCSGTTAKADDGSAASLHQDKEHDDQLSELADISPASSGPAACCPVPRDPSENFEWLSCSLHQYAAARLQYYFAQCCTRSAFPYVSWTVCKYIQGPSQVLSKPCKRHLSTLAGT